MKDSCERCGIGRITAIKAPYVMRLGKWVLVMPDAPAYSCDMCRQVVYDDIFLYNLHHLITPGEAVRQDVVHSPLQTART